MVADWYDGFELTSLWSKDDSRYTLTLVNHGKTPVSGFSLGFSGPAPVSMDSPITGGRMVQRLSNYCEIAAPADFTLAPGASWVIEIGKLDFPIRHWTDGTTTASVPQSREGLRHAESQLARGAGRLVRHARVEPLRTAHLVPRMIRSKHVHRHLAEPLKVDPQQVVVQLVPR